MQDHKWLLVRQSDKAVGFVANAPTATTIPIILLSALGTHEDIRRGYSMGANYYIAKPFTRNELLNGIKLCLGEQ